MLSNQKDHKYLFLNVRMLETMGRQIDPLIYRPVFSRMAAVEIDSIFPVGKL